MGALALLGVGLHQPILWAWLFDTNIQKLEEKTGWEIVTSRVMIEPWAGKFSVSSPSIHGKDGSLILSAGALEGDFSFFASLFSKAWVFESIKLQAPKAVLALPKTGMKNIQFDAATIDPAILEDIPVLQTQRLIIEDGAGELRVGEASQTSWHIDGIHLSLEGDGEHLEGDIVFDTLTWKNPDGVFYYEGKKGLLEMDASNWIHPDQIHLKGFEVQGDEGTVQVSGTLAFLPAWVPNYQLTIQTSVDLDSFFAQPPMVAPIAGKADIELTWLGEANAPPQLKGKALVKALEIDNRKIGTLDIDYHGDLESIYISRGQIQAGGTTLSLFGQVNLKPPFQFSLDTVGENISLYQVLSDVGISSPWVELSANIHTFGEGQVLPEFTFKGQSVGLIKDFKVFSSDAKTADPATPVLYVPQLPLQSNVEMSAAFFDLKDAIFDDGLSRIRADARLYFNGEAGLEIEAFAPQFNFNTIDNKIAGLDFSGQGKVRTLVKGPYKDIKIRGDAEIENFNFEKYSIGKVKSKVSYIGKKLQLRNASILKGRTQLRGDFSLHFKSRKKSKRAPLLLKTDFKVARGFVGDLQNIIPKNPKSGVMDVIKSLPLSGAISGNTQLSGNIAGGQTRSLVGKGQFSSTQGTRLLKQKLGRWNTSFVLDKEQFRLKQFQGSMASGAVKTHLKIKRKEGTIDGQIEMAGLRVAQLDINDELPYGLFGELGFRGTLQGDASNPTVKGQARWKGAGLGPMRFGGLNWAVQVEDKVMDFKGGLWRKQGHMHTRLGLKRPFDFDATISVKDGRLDKEIWPAAWLPDKWEMSSNGLNASWTGNIKNIESTKGNISIPGLRLKKGDQVYRSKGAVALRTVGKTLHADKAAFASDNDEKVDLKGFINSQRIEMRTQGVLNPELFQAHIPKVDQFSGRFKFNLGLTGATSKPRVTGKGDLEKSVIKLSFFPDAFQDVSGGIIFRGKEVAIGQVTARANGAPVALSGTVQHRGVRPTFYDVVINYNNWEGRYPSWLASKSDGRLRLVGVSQKPTLTGEIKIQEARYADNLGSEEFLPEFKTRLKKIQSYQKEEEDLKLDVHILADKKVFVQNNLLNAELKADLFITGTEERIGLRGVVQAIEGQANVRGNRYRLLRGNIDFAETYRIAPRLDIEAETRIKDFDVTAFMMGPLEDLRIKFDSKPKLSEIDVLSLVTLGFTQRELKDAAGTAGAAGLEMVSAYTGLDKELKRLIPASIADTDALSLDELRLTTAFSEKDGSNVPAVVMGVELFEGMRLRIQSTLLEDGEGDTEQKMELEQRLKGKLRWRLVWDSSGESSIGDAGADMWYRWEF